MRISIDKAVFEKFPEFCRGVIVAQGVDNHGGDESLYRELNDLIAMTKQSQSLKDYKNHPNIASWRRAFEMFSTNPNASPPSIQNLIKRATNGASIPFISKLVCIFNIMSLKYVLPLGGDDLKAITGDLRLGFASGNESYTPLGKPGIKENPKPGEIIYYDMANKEVLCRAWCWRNGDRTKITDETSAVAINIDGLPPIMTEKVTEVTQALSEKITEHCGGTPQTYLLSKTYSEIDFAVV